MRYNTDLSDLHPIFNEILGMSVRTVKRVILGRVMRDAEVIVEINIEP